MNCPTCGKPIRGRALFCPSCGQKVSALAPRSSTTQPSMTAASAVPWGASEGAGPFAIEEQGAQGCRRTTIVLVLSGLALLLVVALGVGAVYLGLQDRQEAVRQAALHHYDRGSNHLALQEYELAAAEFGMALQLDPGLDSARDGLDVAQERLEGIPEPTSQLQDEMSAAYLTEMTQAYERQDWPTLFATADRLLAANPTYRRDEVDRLLFEALYQSGLQLVEQDRVTEALRMFDRALLLRPDEQRVSRARELATYYVTGLSYWDNDWALAIENLDRVHTQEPGYRDVGTRLVEAHRALGEQLASAQDWCGAEEQYAAALALTADADLALEREEAAVQCAARERAPTAALTPDAAEDGTPPPAGSYVGEIVGSEGVGSQKMFIRGHVLDGRGVGVGGVRVTIRAWDWSVTATTDGSGQFSFDGLANPVTYTINLEDLPSAPLDVEGKWGELTWIRFQPVE